MMSWLYYPFFYYIITFLWLVTFVLLFLKLEKTVSLSILLVTAGIILLGLFITVLWIKLERPPLRTLGETRLWYSFFLPVIGLAVFIRWQYKWFLKYSLALALVFLTINYVRTETHDKTLMPALQSIWFVPHVIVYIFSYALLAASSIVALKGLFLEKINQSENNTIILADNLVYTGFGFLTLGLLFGALWAKEAWGDYWTWDPKESWALLTWLGYLIYIHVRYINPRKHKTALWILAIAFIILLVCWFGINYMPTARISIHTYTN